MTGLAAFFVAVLASQAPALQDPAAPPGPAPTTAADPLDRAFARVYNYDFDGALSILDEQVRVNPERPLLYSVRAGTYLFMEMARLRILELQFFMHDDNMVDGSAKPAPDPAVKARLFEAIAEARKRAALRLGADADDPEALFALCMSAATEADYIGLVERRTWRSVRLTRETARQARKLLALTPPVYDAYLDAGALEYIVGSLPFFVRWFVHYDGIAGDKRRGIEHLKLTARHGRYYGPYARMLLTVVSLREGKPEEAEKLLAELAGEFPENPLFKKELAVVTGLLQQKGPRRK